MVLGCLALIVNVVEWMTDVDNHIVFFASLITLFLSLGLLLLSVFLREKKQNPTKRENE